MDIQRIFDLGMKGVNLITSLATQGKDISRAATALKNVFSKRPEDVTEAELDEVERVLDELLDEFEKPLKRTK